MIDFQTRTPAWESATGLGAHIGPSASARRTDDCALDPIMEMVARHNGTTLCHDRTRRYSTAELVAARVRLPSTDHAVARVLEIDERGISPEQKQVMVVDDRRPLLVEGVR